MTTTSATVELNRAPIRVHRVSRSARRYFAVAMMLLVLVLRAVTSGPPVALTDEHLAAPTTQANLPMTAAGMALVTAIIAADPALAFAFIVCDMNGFGAYFSLDQWGIAGAFKFRDLEMGLLLAFGLLLWLTRVHAPPRSTRLGRYLVRASIAIAAIGIVYTLATLRVQDLATTARYSRQLYVWLIILAAPQFIRSRRSLERVVVFLVGYAGLSAGLYIAQAVSPPQTILRYSQQMITGNQTRVWSPSIPAIFAGGLAIFAYQLQARHSRRFLWIIFSACSVAIVMSQGRMLTGLYAASIATMVLHRAIVTNRIGLALRVAATAAVVIVLGAAVLWAMNRLDPLLNAWNRRIGELTVDVKQHEGSWTARAEMFEYMPLVIERNGGGLLSQWFGMGLRALTPDQLQPMTFWGVISPPIWADNGLAGVTFTFGYAGLGLLFVFVGTLVRRLRAQFSRIDDPLGRSITWTALLYFAFILPYMFFSAAFMGSWDDALAAVVMLIVAERSAAFGMWRKLAA